MMLYDVRFFFVALLDILFINLCSCHCIDIVSWRDYNNFSCNDYAANKWCSNFTVGPGWNSTWGALTIYRSADDISASIACCQCGADTHVPAVDCQLADWGDWSNCSAAFAESCQRIRKRSVLVPGARGGKPCAATQQTEPCSGCAVCQVGDWAEWGICNAAIGYQVRTRSVQSEYDTGLLCPSLAELGTCSDEIQSSHLDFALYTYGLNDYGQLGIGHYWVADEPTHVVLPSGLAVNTTSFGEQHSIVLTDGGLVYSFGCNTYGQLGLGDDVSRTLPNLVPIPGQRPVKAIAAGSFHTMLLTTDDILYGVGSNQFGQLGLGDVTAVYTAQVVWAEAATVLDFHLGIDHSGMLLSNGTIMMFGSNQFGQLGIGHTPALQRTPSTLELPQNISIKSIAINGFHSAFVLHNGSLYTFGDNDFGQLGLGVPDLSVSTPHQVKMPHGELVSFVALGFHHSAALTQGGQLFMMGNNIYGQLGLGPILSSSVPSAVSIPGNGIVLEVRTGGYHTIIKSEDGWYGFGLNKDHEVTGLDAIDRNTPFLISTDASINIQQVYLGGFHTGFLIQQSVTPTPTMTGTMSESSTPAYTKTSTGTRSLSITRSQSITTTTTPTAILPPCGDAVDIAESPVELTLSNTCIQTYTSAIGSTTWRRYSIHVQLTQMDLSSELALQLKEGCSNTNEPCPVCNDCMRTLHATDVGSVTAFTIGKTSQVVFRVGYSPSAGGILFRAADNANVSLAQISIVHDASAVLLAVVCPCLAIGLLGICVLCWLMCCFWTTHSPQNAWKRNSRLQSIWAQAALVTGSWMVMTGVAWCIVAALTSSHLDEVPLVLLVVGVVLASLGAMGILGCVQWVMRDATQYLCPVCEEPVSRWRFIGTYIPVPGSLTQCQKAHTMHVKCLHCKKPVVDDQWTAFPKSRRYHVTCWQIICEQAIRDPKFLPQWLHQQEMQVTDLELSHILAVAVINSASDVITQLLAVSSGLPAVPVFAEQGRTALHIAARMGNSSVLLQLLTPGMATLDPIAPTLDNPEQSVAVNGLDKDDDDVYIYQPHATLNGHPFYIGCSTGKYLYFFDGSEGEQIPGWCISYHLGSGKCDFRLPIGSSDEPFGSKGYFVPTTNGPKLRNLLKQLKQNLKKTAKKQRPSQAFCPTSVPPEKLLMPRNSIGLQPLPSGLTISNIPHGSSLLMEAIASGDDDTVQEVIDLYHRHYKHCLIWERHVAHNLWQLYPKLYQRELQHAAAVGKDVLTLDFEERKLTIDFENQKEIDGPKVRNLRSRIPPLFQYSDPETKQLTITSDCDAIACVSGALVLFNPSHAACAAEKQLLMNQLVAEGAINFSIISPPVMPRAELQLRGTWLNLAFEEILAYEVGKAACITSFAPTMRPNSSLRANNMARCTRADATGIGGRLTDGLQEEQTSRRVEFYDHDYRNNIGTLPFCATLPQNTVGLRFSLVSILEMAADAILKVAELQRQHYPLNPRYVVAIYVYSYELSPHGDEPLDQIYQAMNQTMRLAIPHFIEFWRPLIWELDMALQALPAYKGKVYRGINCSLEKEVYHTNALIRWTAFSSASQSRSVAEEFAKGDKGTLFFLHSTSAKPISRISRFPEEMEVLFASNTLFQVHSTLHSTSDIGSFYCNIDNIAMNQCDGGTVPNAGLHPRPAGYTSILLHLPPSLCEGAVACLAAMNGGKLRIVQPITADDHDISTQIIIDSCTEKHSFSPRPGMGLVHPSHYPTYQYFTTDYLTEDPALERSLAAFDDTDSSTSEVWWYGDDVDDIWHEPTFDPIRISIDEGDEEQSKLRRKKEVDAINANPDKPPSYLAIPNFHAWCSKWVG